MLFCPPPQMVPRLCLASVYTERLSCLFVFYLEKRNTLPIYHNIEHCIIQESGEKSEENNKKEKEIEYSQSTTLAVAPLHPGAGVMVRQEIFAPGFPQCHLLKLPQPGQVWSKVRWGEESF